jgi:large subunit ribosomal protein L21
MTTYAIISLGGKQYRVREGERLLVDRLPHGEGKTFNPSVLLVGGGDSAAQYAPSDVTVTARVVSDTLGPKIRIGKYKPKVGYKKHTGFRASLTQIEIESIGAKGKRAAAKPAAAEAAPAKAAAAPKAEAPAAEAPKVEAPAAEAPAAEAPKGMPAGYDDLKVTEIKEQSQTWRRPQLEAALAYEQAGANRKGAIAALEAALAAKEDS